MFHLRVVVGDGKLLVCVQVLMILLESETEYTIILHRAAMEPKPGEVLAVGVRLTVGRRNSILYKEQNFDERWYQDKRYDYKLMKYWISDGYQ